MADFGDELLEALKKQRNRALDSLAVTEAQLAKARSDNAKLTVRVEELGAEIAAKDKALMEDKTPSENISEKEGAE